MKRLRTIWIATIIGSLIEGCIILAGLVFFNYGADGPAPGFSTIMWHFHTLGLTLLHEFDTRNDFLGYSMIFIPQILIYACILYPVIHVIRKRKDKNSGITNGCSRC